MTVRELRNLLDMGIQALATNRELVSVEFLDKASELLPTIQGIIHYIAPQFDAFITDAIRFADAVIEGERRMLGPLGDVLEELLTKLSRRPLLLMVISKWLIR